MMQQCHHSLFALKLLLTIGARNGNDFSPANIIGLRNLKIWRQIQTVFW